MLTSSAKTWLQWWVKFMLSGHTNYPTSGLKRGEARKSLRYNIFLWNSKTFFDITSILCDLLVSVFAAASSLIMVERLPGRDFLNVFLFPTLRLYRAEGEGSFLAYMLTNLAFEKFANLLLLVVL
jgi:hypothetical protein